MDSNSIEELVAQGVSLFSAGDLAGAARAWLTGLKHAPGDRRIVGYLKHMKKVAPEILSIAETELSVNVEEHIQLSMPPIEVVSGERVLFVNRPTTSSASVSSQERTEIAAPPVAPSTSADDSKPTPQQPYVGRGHFPDVEPSAEPGAQATIHDDALEPNNKQPELESLNIELEDDGLEATLAERIESLQQCLRADDLTGALHIAEELESLSPRHPMALAARQHCKPKLEAMWLSELGGDGGLLEMKVASHELLRSNLDAASGFLISQIDGRTSVSQLLQLSGQERFDGLRGLYSLKVKGLIQIVQPT